MVSLWIRQSNTMKIVIPDLIRNPAKTNIGAPCAPLVIDLVVTPEGVNPGRYDSVTNYWPDQYL